MAREEEQIAIGLHVLYPDRELLRGDARVPIGARALAILSALAESPNHVVTKDTLLDRVWGGVTVEENALQVHIAALRKALGEDSDRIETVRGVGYKLHVTSADEDAESPSSGASSSIDSLPPSRADDDRASFRPSLIKLAAILLLPALALMLFWAFPRSDAEAAIVVAPLEAISASPDDMALAAGISDELVLRLRRIDGLRVVTSEAGGDNEAPISKGTLQSDGQSKRLVARLEQSDGTVIWSESYDREFFALLDVQEEIARSIAGALSVPLEVGLEAKAMGGTDNPEAYAQYVQGRANRQHSDRTIPTRHLERALALDPDYVKALTELTFVDGLTLYSEADLERAERLKERMDRHSQRAFEINPEVWQAHAARGWYHLLQQDFVAAQQSHDTVMALDEGNDPELLHTLANFNAQLGRQELAIRTRTEKSLIDPFFPEEPLPYDALMLKEYGKVIQAFEDIDISASPNRNETHPVVLYWALRLSGRTDEARALAQQVGQGNPLYAHYASMDYSGLLVDLPYPELKAYAEERLGAGGRDVLAELAMHASQLGNHRLALDYLTLAFKEREVMGGYYSLWHPALAPTRETPEFAEWLVDFGMDKVWRSSGDWGDYCRPVDDKTITCK